VAVRSPGHNLCPVLLHPTNCPSCRSTWLCGILALATCLKIRRCSRVVLHKSHIGRACAVASSHLPGNRGGGLHAPHYLHAATEAMHAPLRAYGGPSAPSPSLACTHFSTLHIAVRTHTHTAHKHSPSLCLQCTYCQYDLSSFPPLPPTHCSANSSTHQPTFLNPVSTLSEVSLFENVAMPPTGFV